MTVCIILECCLYTDILQNKLKLSVLHNSALIVPYKIKPSKLSTFSDGIPLSQKARTLLALRMFTGLSHTRFTLTQI